MSVFSVSGQSLAVSETVLWPEGRWEAERKAKQRLSLPNP